MRTYLLLVILVIIWALNVVFAKLGLNYMPPAWLTASRLVIGTVSAFILLIPLKRLKLPKRQDWPFIFSIGVLQIGIFQMFFNYGITEVNAGRASILTYSTPLWVTPIAILFFGEKLTRLKLLGLILGIAGIFVLFSPAHFDWSDKKVLIGNGFLLLASLCWAIAMLHSRYGKWHSSPLELLPWQLLIASILPCIIAPITEPWHLIQWHPVLIGVLLFSGILATALGYWMVVTVSKELPVITTSLALLSTPVLTLLFSVPILNEPLTANNLLSVMLIIAGLTCITLNNKRQQ
jgi:drug/metabolite transporter (DMT)-like permease